MEVVTVSKDELKELIETTVRATVSEFVNQRVPPVMTKKQLAKYLDKPISTIDRYMREGMPCFRADERSYPEFYPKAVDEWLANRHAQHNLEVVQ